MLHSIAECVFFATSIFCFLMRRYMSNIIIIDPLRDQILKKGGGNAGKRKRSVEAWLVSKGAPETILVGKKGLICYLI